MAKISDIVYWDSCVIIDCLQKNNRYHHIEPLVKEAELGNLYIVVSAICYAEVFKLPGEDDDLAATRIEQFFDQRYVDVNAASEKTMREAGRIRKILPLETADAIHVATALERKVPILLTRDGEKRNLKNGKKTILELAPKLKASIQIMTPAEYYEQIGSESKQAEIDKATLAGGEHEDEEE